MVRNKVILGPIFGGVLLSRIIFLGDSFHRENLSDRTITRERGRFSIIRGGVIDNGGGRSYFRGAPRRIWSGWRTWRDPPSSSAAFRILR